MAIVDFRGEYRWLSNFGESPLDICNPFLGSQIKVSTIEHAYQAHKTLDLKQRLWVLDSKTPRIAQARGQKVDLRYDWDNIKLTCMKILVEAKFKQNSALAGRLIETGSQHLVEGNTWGDVYWGVCDGNGLNHLGRILMDVREKLK